jgi:fused signal recognition particle receptor
MGIFSKFKAGLKKTKDSMINKMHRVVNSFTKIDEELFEQLEETMIMSDIGVETSLEICSRLRKKIKEQGVTDPALIMDLIQEIVAEMMGDDTSLNMSTTPSIIMVIGVNGAGKTTTIGKLCHQLKSEGKKVIVAAADTFRAAAIDQLQVWTERAGVDIVKHAEGSDPGAVVYDAIQAAKARNCDVLIIDTAGRLHNKKNLMEELAKINRIMSTQAEGCSKEVLLVLDATTGQNAVNQARLFSETAELTGIVLTKLDGTAKGGIVISIMNELNIPVKLVGVGEQIDDLQPFDSKSFVTALFEDNDAESEEAETTESDEISENETAEIEAEEATEYTEETSDETETAEEIETENYTDTVTESETEIETEISDTEEAEAEESVSENTEEAAEVTEEEEKNEETEKSKKKGFFSKFFRGDK